MYNGNNKVNRHMLSAKSSYYLSMFDCCNIVLIKLHIYTCTYVCLTVILFYDGAILYRLLYISPLLLLVHKHFVVIVCLTSINTPGTNPFGIQCSHWMVKSRDVGTRDTYISRHAPDDGVVLCRSVILHAL